MSARRINDGQSYSFVSELTELPQPWVLIPIIDGDDYEALDEQAARHAARAAAATDAADAAERAS